MELGASRWLMLQTDPDPSAGDPDRSMFGSPGNGSYSFFFEPEIPVNECGLVVRGQSDVEL